ncbi:hypothetical protein [Bathymodiolus japonicus methanotrophic gill symbiont]|uniref:hypothetical protein n=1 Tax=Bathymodiolus japonicus methanotrophic gill symbiont TaxID=113269 RepID=UPI001C8D01A0|nr:hypothetical protein [Bathymodiolus japonicus methanotrophic gill symbiont]
MFKFFHPIAIKLLPSPSRTMTQRLRTKAASSLLPHWLDGYSECNSCSSRVLLAHVESANCPVAYQGLKINTSLSYVSMIFSGSNQSQGILALRNTQDNAATLQSPRLARSNLAQQTEFISSMPVKQAPNQAA